MKPSSEKMALDDCGKFIKASIFVINFLILLGGLAILGLGIWTMTDHAHVQQLLGSDSYEAAATLMMALGGIVSIIAFLGCCGAIGEVKCLLLMFFIIMALIAVLIIVGVIFAFTSSNKVEHEFTETLKQSMKGYSKDDSIKNAWDYTQEQLKCCGASGPVDWKTVRLPASCRCVQGDEDTPCVNDFWEKGCEEAIKDLILKHSTALLSVGIVTIIVIILAMIFSCSLYLRI